CAPDPLDELPRASRESLARADDEAQWPGGALVARQLGQSEDPGYVADQHVVPMLGQSPVDLRRRNLARKGAEGSELGDGAREPGTAIPVVIVRGADHAIARTDPDVIQPDRHEAGRRLHLVVRVVDGLATPRRSTRLVEHLGRSAQEVLGMVDEVLRSGEEITQLRRMRDAGHVHTALPEEPLVERGMAGDVVQGSPQLPGLDAV